MGGKWLFQSTCPSPGPSWREGTQDRNLEEETEAETMEKYLEASQYHIKHQSRKCATDLPTSQSYKGVFSVEILSFLMTSLYQVDKKKKKLYPAQDKSHQTWPQLFLKMIDVVLGRGGGVDAWIVYYLIIWDKNKTREYHIMCWYFWKVPDEPFSCGPTLSNNQLLVH